MKRHSTAKVIAILFGQTSVGGEGGGRRHGAIIATIHFFSSLFPSFFSSVSLSFFYYFLFIKPPDIPVMFH